MKVFLVWFLPQKKSYKLLLSTWTAYAAISYGLRDPVKCYSLFPSGRSNDWLAQADGVYLSTHFKMWLYASLKYS